MSADRIGDLIARARTVAGGLDEATPESRRAQLASIAAEFESMLLGQMLGAMRQSAKWGDEDTDEGFGGQALFDVVDVELVSELSRSGGLGLGRELLKSLDRSYGPGGDAGGGAGAGMTGATPGAMPPGPARSVDPDAVAQQVTSGYGWRADPFSGRDRFHKGLDLAAAYGDDVRAAAPGRVVFRGEQSGYGTTVVVEHPDGARSRYAHLSSADVAEGTLVEAGQSIGRAGSSGRATGPHVHFEVTVDGRPVDPQAWIVRVATGFKPGSARADSLAGLSAFASPGVTNED